VADDLTAKYPDAWPARLTITLQDGTTLTQSADYPRGNPENPLSEDELRAKYRELATPVLGAERAARIERAVGALAAGDDALPALLALLLSSTL